VGGLKLAGKFVAHLIIGVALFIVVGLASSLLHHVASFISDDGVSSYVATALNGLELLLFGVDFLCAVLFIAVQTVLFIRALARFCQQEWA
jgi:hypothetical protein